MDSFRTPPLAAALLLILLELTLVESPKERSCSVMWRFRSLPT